MRLAMTGITSGVGMRLAEMALARGDEVVGLVRSPGRDDAKRLASLGVGLRTGDLDSKDVMEAMFRDADAVLHMAAHVGDKGTREEFEKVNVQGTRNVVEAAGAARVKRFVHLSSVAVYGRPDQGRVTEDWPIQKPGTPYEDTKAEAEELAFGRGKELGLEVTAIRPPLIYGPHDKNFMPRLLDGLKHHRFLLVDGGKAPLNVVWVDHVADVALLAAASPKAPGEAFNVMDEVDSRPPSVREVGEAVAAAAGYGKPRISLPFPVAMKLAQGVEWAWHKLHLKGSPPLTPFVVTVLTRDVIYDASKAVRVLGWGPKVRAIHGLAEAARQAKQSLEA